MKKWLFPCNLGKYDILGSFLKNGFVDYGTNLNLSEGDEVFIYTGAPYSAIFLKCRVRAILKIEETIDDSEFSNEDDSINEKSKYVRLVPIQNYLNKIDRINHIKLKENGIKGFNLQIEITDQLGRYLDSI
ncbi:hypothetical protein [Clostridium botulinum]|uniref:hypothetical protein n=1 Tax=Clostridium botulinum TaxID=1491 RepID=UPI001966FE90|nr:hypothetical protein [Clostridium botulinum]MBN1065397.1 hypothetical protein [Clostridium botulinum]